MFQSLDFPLLCWRPSLYLMFSFFLCRKFPGSILNFLLLWRPSFNPGPGLWNLTRDYESAKTSKTTQRKLAYNIKVNFYQSTLNVYIYDNTVYLNYPYILIINLIIFHITWCGPAIPILHDESTICSPLPFCLFNPELSKVS